MRILSQNVTHALTGCCATHRFVIRLDSCAVN